MQNSTALNRLVAAASAAYAVRLAITPAEIHAAQALRFAVFNLEMNEGLPESQLDGLDADAFDEVCEHLLVEHLPTAEIVGTYRLQTGASAGKNLGYYSAQEFDFAPFEHLRGELVELGRACVHKQHRNIVVLGLLWKGIADYAREQGARYLIGCSSIPSQDTAIGATVYADLCRHHLAPREMRTVPLPAYEFSLGQLADDAPSAPKLLRAYLSIGAKICGPPALDREFKTIDFLTLLDLHQLSQQTRARFFGE
ncbi:MAG TPA: GNAT family N-acyltransferase [Verrucomicrobiae bacterium]|nr:GNAT family N-acyltransferase [Verrucomicrobiae bacterium]